MRFVGPVLFAVFSAIVIAFSVKNLKSTEINPWPFADPIDVPTYLVVFAAFLVGFFSGAVVAWVSGIQGRRRRKRRKVERDARKETKRRSPGTVSGTAPDMMPSPPLAATPAPIAPVERAVYTTPEKE